MPGIDLSLHEYEVLLTLADAPDGRMRMSELAAAVVLSQSGLTRLVDRLVRDGSVARIRCEGDRRGLNAELTDAGRRRYLEARVTHLGGRPQSVRRIGSTRPSWESSAASGNASPPARPQSE